MKPVELMMQRRQVAAWKVARSVELVLTRYTRTADGAGGWTRTNPQTLMPQKFRIVVFKRRLTQFMDNIEEGNVPNLSYTVVGPPDADIEVGDTFVFEGKDYEVEAVDPDHEIRKTSVARYKGDQYAI